MNPPLTYYYRKYQCCALSGMAWGYVCGCCGGNTSKCAEIYWAACCPCRTAFSLACCGVGLLCDVGCLLGHCYGDSKWLQCTEEWCGCQCLPLRREQPDGTILVETDSAFRGITLRSSQELLYYVCCVTGNSTSDPFLKHCQRCEPGATLPPAIVPVPAPATRPPSHSVSSTQSATPMSSSLSISMTRE